MAKQSQKKPTLTKSAAKKFADFLFYESDSEVRFTKLCDGKLKEGKLHCALGEAYHHFVNPSLKHVLNKDIDSKYNEDFSGATGAAIDALVEAAARKPGVSKEDLAHALGECVSSNDGIGNYLERAKEVAEVWNQEVVPLLK